MSAFPARSGVSGTPTRATANTAFGALWDWLNELFVSGAATAGEKATARAALEATRRMSPIDATVAANALTVAIKPNATEFRSATLTSGAVSFLANAADLTVVVPNGATLGSANGVLTKLAVLEINNSGAKEAALVNLAGGVDLSESGVISTTTISTGADSVNVIYSTTGRTNVAYRLVGFVEYTQATAGVYSTAPSLVNPASAPLAMWLCGYGQSWQSVTRSPATTYTNISGRSISLNLYSSASSGTNELTVGGVVVAQIVFNNSGGTMPAEIPPGASYSYTGTAMNARELR